MQNNFKKILNLKYSLYLYIYLLHIYTKILQKKKILITCFPDYAF